MSNNSGKCKVCPRCGNLIFINSSKCNYCGTSFSSGGMSNFSKYIILVVVFVVVTVLAYKHFNKDKSGSNSNNNTNAASTAQTSQNNSTANKNVNSSSNKQSTNSNESNAKGTNGNTDVLPTKPAAQTSLVTNTDNKNLRVGDIILHEGVYMGLSYVKRMDYLPTELGKSTPKEGNEVILCFFDCYNASEEENAACPGGVSCYADGIQVDKVDTYFETICDGIRENKAEALEPGTQLIGCTNFEVPCDWKELKLYYRSTYIWTVTREDVHEEDFVFESMYNVNNPKTITSVGDILYSDNYEIEYKGFEIYHEDNIIYGDVPYAAFKYCITNKGTEPLDLDYVGHRMKCYRNNYFLEGSDYRLDDKIDGYTNLYKVKDIEPGMSANIYVAFKSSDEPGFYYMIFDDGLFISQYRGYIYIKYEK